jgi:hypothetical protein
VDFCRPIRGIGVFVPDESSPTRVLRVLHGIQLFPGIPGQNRDRLKTFAFEGDVVGVDMATIAFYPSQLAITDDIIVLGSIARTRQLLAVKPTHNILGHFTTEAVNTQATKYQRAIYIPFEVMELVMGKELTARQAYELIIPRLIDSGYESLCEPLVDFLTVALVKPSDGVSIPLTMHACAGKPGYVPSPAVVNYRRDQILYGDLPALMPVSTPSPASDPALLGVARGMRDMVIEARLDPNDRNDAREVARRPRTVRDRLGEFLTDRLLLLCRAPDDDELPPLYHEWAARLRGVSERYILQQGVDAAAAVLDVPSFEVTPTQVMAFKNFRYAGSTYFDIGSGLLPFSITPSDATSVQARAMLAADRVRADAFDLGADPENGAVAPGEVARLHNLSGYTPQTWNEARSQLSGMQALMGALLGNRHPAVAAYGRFLRRYSRMLSRLEFEIDHAHGSRLGPSIMAFHVQLAWRNWMVVQLEAEETEAIDPPDFGTGLTMLETQNNLMWLPSITNVPMLLNLSVPIRARPVGRTPGPALPIIAPAPAPSSAAYHVPTPPGGVPDVAPVARRDQGRPVRNTARVSLFTAYSPIAQNVRSRRVSEAIALAGPPPMVDRSGATIPMCVFWNSKGVCFANCDHVADHGALSAEEAVTFQAWRQVAFVCDTGRRQNPPPYCR